MKTLLLHAMVLIVALAAPDFTMARSGIVQVTNNDIEDLDPQIYDGLVTWKARDSDYTFGDILLWDGVVTRKISDSNFYNSNQQIHDGQVTWEGLGSSLWVIFFWDGQNTRQITNDNSINEYPHINNGQIVWRSDMTSISFWDGNNILSVADYGVPCDYATVENGRVVYSMCTNEMISEYDIMIWEGGPYSTNLGMNDGNDSNPRQHCGQICWMNAGRYPYDQPDIYLWDGASIIRITNNDVDDDYPQIYNGAVTWQHYDGHDWEICYWNDGTTEFLTQNSHDDINPVIFNGHVAWQGFDGKDYEIYFWDGHSVHQVTNNPFDDVEPQLHNDQITWSGFDGHDYEIYFWEFKPALPGLGPSALLVLLAGLSVAIVYRKRSDYYPKGQPRL